MAARKMKGLTSKNQHLILYAKIIKKVLRSKILTKDEGINLCTLFMEVVSSEPEYVGIGDELYNSLLDEQIRLYEKKNKPKKCWHCGKLKGTTFIIDKEEGGRKNYRLCRNCTKEEDDRAQERLDAARRVFR